MVMVTKTNNPLPEKIEEGVRNQLLFREGCRLRQRGYTKEEILIVLQTINKSRCESPLSDGEVQTIAESAARYEIG
jgi:primase-like protein